jgi:hypothetical protein
MKVDRVVSKRECSLYVDDPRPYIRVSEMEIGGKIEDVVWYFEGHLLGDGPSRVLEKAFRAHMDEHGAWIEWNGVNEVYL